MKNIAKTDSKRQPKITTEMNGKGLTVRRSSGAFTGIKFYGEADVQGESARTSA